MIGRKDGDKGENEGESFAELVGETKPIRRGPARATVSKIVSAPVVRDDANATPSKAAFRWPDPDEPRLAAAPGVSDADLYALGRGEAQPEEQIDLHGVRRDAAARLLRDRIRSARERGLRRVIVIHGRGLGSGSGEAVLRDGLPGWLSTGACAKSVLAFAPAPARLGGAGATLVLLRRR
jgi:DNA-nicking Smr family endonuclease